MGNPLYYYLKKGLYTSPDSPPKENFLFNESKKEGVPYALYSLPMESKESISDGNKQYLLTEHHLSFYDTFTPGALKRFGEYHYTAVFSNPTGENFKLHAFFDRQDHCFSYDFTDTQGKTIPIPNLLVKRFVQLAIENSRHFISDLRHQHLQTLAHFKHRYDKQEQHLSELSKSSSRSLEYRSALGETLTTLETLSPLDNAYTSIYRLLSRREKIITLEEQQREAVLSRRAKEIEEDHPADDLEVLTETSPTEEQKTEKTLPSVSQPIQQASRDEARYLQSLEKKSLSPTDQERQVALFTALHGNVTDTALALAEDQQATTLEELQTLQGLVVRLPRHGELLLKKLLKERNFKLAEKLSNVVEQLPPTSFEQALREGDAPLLDFLLTHGKFAINTFLVDGLTPVLYCYKKHTDTTPLVDCLSVLIKHGASMLIKDTDGLPLAYQILSDPFHPLRKAAFQNAPKMLCPSMWAMLETMLLDYLRQHPTLPLAKARTLREGAAAYRKSIDLMKVTMPGALSKIARSKMHDLPMLGEIPAVKNMRDTLMSDPEVMDKLKQLRTVMTRFISAQSEKDKRSALCKNTAPQLPSAIEQEAFQRMTSFPHADAKQFIMEYFNDYITIFDTSNTIQNLAKIARQKGTKHKKAAKNALQQISRLRQEIAPLLLKHESQLLPLEETLSSKKYLALKKQPVKDTQSKPPLLATQDTSEILSRFQKTPEEKGLPKAPARDSFHKDLLDNKDARQAFDKLMGKAMDKATFGKEESQQAFNKAMELVLLPFARKMERKPSTTPQPSFVTTSSNLFPKPGSLQTAPSRTPGMSMATKPNLKSSRPT